MLGANASKLIEIAVRRTGLNDLGDPSFAVALERLTDSLERESTITAENMPAARERLIRLIVNRLRFEDDLRKHPEILTRPLLPPLVICGLPRVGSTKMHQILAHSGDFRRLLFWQGFNAAPFPSQATGVSDPRIEEAVKFLAWRARANPAVNAGHFMAAQNPEEDTYLLEYTLHTYWPTSYFEVPSFLGWLKTQDRDRAYEYVGKLLRYLQWQFDPDARKPWVLKSPPNFGFEAEMARHMPGARFLVLHRDPVQVIPSTAAIVREVRRLYCGAPADVKTTGAWALEQYAADMDRHLAWRRDADSSNILDVPYRDVRDDGIEVARRVYRFCGMTLSSVAETRMRDWADKNAQHKHGVHTYSLEEFGLTEATINEKFAGYKAAFGPLLGS